MYINTKILSYLIIFFLMGCNKKFEQCSIIEKSLYAPTEFNYHNVSRGLKDIPFIISRNLKINKILFNDANNSKKFYGSKSIVYSDALLYNAVASCDSEDNRSFYYLSKKAYDIYFENKRHYLFQFNNEEQKNYIEENKRYLISIFTATYSFQKKKNIADTFNKWLNYKRTLYDIDNAISLSNPFYNKLKKELARLNQEERDYSKIKFITKKLSHEYKSSLQNIEHKIQKKISFKDIHVILKPNELYIDFVKIGKNYYCFTLDHKNNITFEQFNINKTKEIDLIIRTIKNNIKKEEYIISKAQKNYNKLYNLIFKNINIKNKTSLIISPDGELNEIPFEAFYDGEKYLIQKLNIRYIPSGKEFVKLYQKNNQSNNKVIVFANPDFGLNQNSTNHSELKGNTIETLYHQKTFFETLSNQDEPKTIKKLYNKNAQIYLGKNATESNFFKIKSPKILHLSTHGFYLEDKNILNPMLKSGIALSGANNSIKNRKGDGIITALELSGMDLSHTELVVLSACETGVGEIENGEGVAGLSKAFMTAGAKYIVMSLWNVPTKPTGVLMKRFYENLHRGYGYSKALREAKIWWIENKNSHPFFWSGFVGSGRD